MLPRGIRNNNPLNIRRGKDQWQGLRAQQTDASFCQFESLEYGWRAAFYLLTRTYYYKYRLFTIRAIINKWAPPQENLTSTYIANVSRLTGIPPDEPIGIPSDQPQRWMAVGVGKRGHLALSTHFLPISLVDWKNISTFAIKN